ncbi:MAG: BatD family protein [Candidatus Omnitrophota bacterium]
MKTIKTILAVIWFAAAFAGVLQAQNKFEASLEMERVYPGNPVYLYLSFTGSSNIRQPEVAPVDGLNIRHVGSSTQMTVVNNAMSQSITYSYLVVPLRVGQYEIGPFFAVFAGQTYRAEPVTLVVEDVSGSASQPGPGPSAQSQQAPGVRSGTIDGDTAFYQGNDVFLRMEIDKTRLYVNEVVPVTIKLYVDNVGLKDIEYPVYAHDGFSSGEFIKPERKRESYRGKIYEILEFRQDLSAFKEGDYLIGPAVLRCKMMSRKQRTSRRSSIFGVSIFMDDPFTTGYETYPIELASNEISMSVLPFPESGKPDSFKGAVGVFSFDVDISSSDVKVGDPITVTMTVSGTGNLDTVTAPAIPEDDDFRVYEPVVSKKGNRKAYEQILIPRTDDVKEIPALSFSFLNPMTGKYETIEKGPFRIKVSEAPETQQPLKMVAMPSGEHIFRPKEELGEDILHIKYDMGKTFPPGYLLINDNYFRALQLIFPALFLVFYFSYKKRHRIRTDRGYARLLKAPRRARSGMKRAKALMDKGDIAGFYDAVQKTLEEYLGNKFDLSRGSVTASEISEKLVISGADEEVIRKVNNVLSMCEMARYASSVSESGDHAKILEDTRRIIDHVEKM